MFYDQLDAHLLGGTQWGWTDAFKPYTKDGWNQENFSVTDQRRNLRSNFAIRPYPRAIAGVPGGFQVPASACRAALLGDVVSTLLQTMLCMIQDWLKGMDMQIDAPLRERPSGACRWTW